MFCKKCGKIIDENLELCEECEAMEKMSVAGDDNAETTKPSLSMEKVEAEQAVAAEEGAVAKKQNKLNCAWIALILGIAAVALVYLGDVWIKSISNDYVTLRYSYEFFDKLAREIGFGRSLVEEIFKLLAKPIENEKWMAFLFFLAVSLLYISIPVALAGGVFGFLGVKKQKKEAKECASLNKELLFSIIGLALSVIAIFAMVAVHTEIEASVWSVLYELVY